MPSPDKQKFFKGFSGGIWLQEENLKKKKTEMEGP